VRTPSQRLAAVDASFAAGDAMSDALKPSQLLDVEVNEVAWIGPLIPIGWLRRLEKTQSRQTVSYQDTSYRRSSQSQSLRDLFRRQP
jgi:hypothetical protein